MFVWTLYQKLKSWSMSKKLNINRHDFVNLIMPIFNYFELKSKRDELILKKDKDENTMKRISSIENSLNELGDIIINNNLKKIKELL